MNLAVVALTRWRLSVRRSWYAGRARRGLVPTVLSLIMLLVFSSTFAMLFQSLAASGTSSEGAGRVLAWAFTVAFGMLLVGDMHLVVNDTVTAPDLERLRLTPLRDGELLLLKLAELLPGTLQPVLGIALPAAVFHALYFGGAGLPATLVALVTLWTVPLGLGCALALLLLRVSPAARLRESLAVLATFALIAGWLLNAFWVPRLAGDTASIAAGVERLPAPPAWSPATWAADALARGGARATAALFGCALASLVALALAWAAAERLLGKLHAQAVTVADTVVRASARRARTLAGAFLRRDAALVSRDWPVLLDTLASFALWALLPLAILPVAPLPHQELARDMLLALSASLGNDLAARSLPLERDSLAWARLSPVGGARWVRMRALGVAVVAVSALGIATLLVSLALRLPLAGAVDALGFGLAAAACTLGTGMMVGAWLGDPKWTHPRAMLGIGGRTVSAVLILGQVVLWAALTHELSPGAPLPLWGLAILMSFGLLIGAGLLFLTARFLERMEFTER